MDQGNYCAQQMTSNLEQELEHERQVLMASVRSLAEFNLGRQQEFESDRRKLTELVDETTTLKNLIEQKSQKLVELSKKTSLETTLNLLLVAASQAEEDSDDLAQSFLSEAIDYPAFVDDYIDKRKLAHLRRIKADRLRTETNDSWTGSRTASFGHPYQ